MENKKLNILINGAGVSGLALALSLNPEKFNVTITDKRNIGVNHTKKGRAINFTLTKRGLNILEDLNLSEKILASAVQINGRLVHDQSGETHQQTYSVKNNSIFSIQRSRFLDIFIDEVLKKTHIAYKPQYELLDLDKFSNKATFKDKYGNKKELHADLIVGADGLFSKVREQVIQGEQLSLKQKIFKWEYLECSIFPEEVVRIGLSLNHLHVYPDKDSILIAIPNQDKSMSALFLAKSISEHEFNNSSPINKLCNALKDFKPTSGGKKSRLMGIQLSKWTFNESIVLIGDSCHAVYPFYGQGMNSALEDAIELAKQLSLNNTLSDALTAYEQKRILSAWALNELSETHFDILFNSSSKSTWNAKNFVDHKLAKLFPKFWVFEYEQVAHTNLPYDSIYKQINRQKKLRFILGIFIFQWIIAFFSTIKHHWNLIWKILIRLNLKKFKLFLRTKYLLSMKYL